MASRIITGILVALVCGAIGRGIVLAFGLDKIVARMIQSATAMPSLPAIAWILSGLIGLVGLVAWQLFHVDEKLYGMFAARPALGSLSFEEPFVTRISRSIGTGKTDAEISVNLKNSNDFLLKFHATISGDVNGKQSSQISFDGYAYPAKQASLILRISDIPGPGPQSQSIKTEGHFQYDVTYYPAASEQRTRRTMKRISFESIQPLQNVPGSSGAGIKVLFLEEKEE
jgi:hypothetical protein